MIIQFIAVSKKYHLILVITDYEATNFFTEFWIRKVDLRAFFMSEYDIYHNFCFYNVLIDPTLLSEEFKI